MTLQQQCAPEFTLASIPQSPRPGQHGSFRDSLLWNHIDNPLAYQRSVSLCNVDVGLLDLFLRFIIRELLTHVLLHVSHSFALYFTTADNSVFTFVSVFSICSCGTSTIFCTSWLVVNVGGNLLRHHVCRETCVLCCLGDASLHLDFAICGVGVGPPTAFRRNGHSVPWVSLPRPTGVMTHPG